MWAIGKTYFISPDFVGKYSENKGRNATMEKVRQSGKALYFSNAEGLSFRLGYYGINGWRLQNTK